MFMFLVLYVNRWNKLNGKAGGLGMIIAAANSASIGYAMDGGDLSVIRGWYVIAGLFSLAALHLMFNANPMLTSAMLLEKEKAKALKAKKA